MPLTIIARITAAEGKAVLVRRELEKLIPPTLAEEGCLQYDLHQDTGNPCVFVFYENWESRDLWQRHMNAPHIAAFGRATQGAIADAVLNEMNRVGV